MYERAHGLTILHPPVAYSDDLARRAAVLAGYNWYFSIADFDEALLTGTLELKAAHDESSIAYVDTGSNTPRPACGWAATSSASVLAFGMCVLSLNHQRSSLCLLRSIDLTQAGSALAAAKPPMMKKRSPSSIMDM
jgi:hypothetical protein